MKPFDLRKFLTEEGLDLQNAAQGNTKEEWARLRSEHVNYMPPSASPFKCGHCKFFDGTNRCKHPEVNAHVEAEGCCNEFQPTEKR